MNGQVTRAKNRKNSELRNIRIIKDYIKNAEGSCLINFGNTSVICTASIENSTPNWLRGSGQGWLTAEYSMLPSSTSTRNIREISKGKLSGRTQEIQRLIGRSLRAAINLKIIGEKLITIDCDVINADGGTRTAAITGGWVALKLAIQSQLKSNKIKKDPIINQVAAISCGVFNNEILIDLDYLEDSSAETDANFVITNAEGIIEVQATAEKKAFNKNQLDKMTNLAIKKTNEMFLIQSECIKNES